jgi:hypothetical protein
VLAYLAENYGDRAPALGLTWAETDVTPGLPDKPVPGSTSLQYVAADWVMTLSYPVVRPDLVVYQVTVENAALGFKWEGEVDAVGQVTEQSASTGGQPVVAWFGRVVSLPVGSQFDDYLSLMPEGAGEIGVEGVNEAIEAQIVALRDKEMPGRYAHFWGTLTCDVLDYGGCEVLVTRLRVDGPGLLFDPVAVDGWEGSIVSMSAAGSAPAAPQVDDAFVLAGSFAAGYGIDSVDPTLAAQLEGLRDTGTTIRVWGELICPAIDAYGTRIAVNRIEIVREAPAPVPTPAPTSWTEPVDNWWGEIVSNPPSSQWDDYFQRQIVNGGQYGIESLDPELQAQIVALHDTGTTVHVWGTLHHHVPDFSVWDLFRAG